MPESGPPHILAIDDEPELRSLYADILDAEGYDVTLAGRPPSIAEVVALRPDLILLDLVIDGAPSGWDYLDALGGDERARAIPVLLCTAAAADVRDRDDDLRQAGIDVVVKPFDLDDFLAAIRRCLRAAEDAPARRRLDPGAD